MNNAKKIYKKRKKIIESFKNGIIPLIYDEKQEDQTDTKKKKIISEIKMVLLIIKSFRD